MTTFTTLQPFPWEMTPMNNIAVPTYRDGTTYTRNLEQLKAWLNDQLVPGVNDALAGAFAEYQAALANAEQTVTDAKGGWQAQFDAFLADITAQLAALSDDAVAGLLDNPATQTGAAFRVLTAEFVDDPVSAVRAALDRLYKSPVLDARDFGVKADGTTDDTAAIQAALTFLANNPGRELRFTKGGTVKLTTPLGRYAISNTIIDFGTTTIDASAITTFNGDILTIGGAQAFTRNTAADIADDTRTVAIDTTGFAPGDMVLILSDTVFDPARTGSKYGEINYIKTVDSAGQLTLQTPVQAGYLTATTARLTKLVPVTNLTIRGGKFTSTTTDNTLRGLFIEYGRNIHLTDVAFDGINRVQAQLGSCAESFVTGCTFANARHASQGYGVSVLDAAQDIDITTSTFTNVRHSLSTNNTIAHGGIVRRINFHHNKVIASAPATGGTGGDAIDTHAGAEEISINHNSVTGSSNSGINMEAKSGEIIGNQISGTAGYGINCTPYSNIPGRITIANNKMRRVSGLYGIAVTASGADIEELNITGNTVQGQVSGIRIFNSVNGKAKKATIAGNNVKASTGTGITVLNGSRVNVVGNTVDSAGNFGITLDGCSGSTVSSNVVDVRTTDGSAAHCIRIQGTADKVNVVGNNVEYTGAGVPGVRAVSFTGTVTDSGMFNNVARNTAFGYEIGAGAGNAQANNI